MQGKALLLGLSILALVGATGDPDTALKAANFDAARAGYAKAVRADPHDVHALVGLATMELYDNELVDAQRDARRALTLDTSNEQARRLERTVALRLTPPGEFVVDQHADAVLPFVQSQPLPVITLRIDGTDARVVLDTGAGGLTISPEFARKHRLPLETIGIGIFAGGKRAPIQGTNIATVVAGPIAIRNLRAMVSPGPAPDIDGVIGTSFFSHFLTTVDYPRHRLILRRRDAALPSNPVAIARMWLVGDHFIFANASINGLPPMLFNVDSGADFGVQLSKSTLEAAGIEPERKAESFAGGGGTARVFPLTVKSVSIGAARVNVVSGVYFPDGDQYGIFPFAVAGTLSGGFLSHYAVTYDFTRMRITLSM